MSSAWASQQALKQRMAAAVASRRAAEAEARALMPPPPPPPPPLRPPRPPRPPPAPPPLAPSGKRSGQKREAPAPKPKKFRAYVPPSRDDDGDEEKDPTFWELAVRRMKTARVPPAPAAGEADIGELQHSSMRAHLTAPLVERAMATEPVQKALQRYGRPIMEVRLGDGSTKEIDLLLTAKVEGCVQYKAARADPEFRRRLAHQYAKFLEEGGLARPPVGAEAEPARFIRWCEAYLDPTLTRHLESKAFKRHRRRCPAKP